VALSELVQELGALFRQLLDLGPDVFESSHVLENALPRTRIP
jgi:hypothetical protein